MKRVIILGSTGSIGRNTLDVIRRHNNKFEVIGLSAFGNTGLLKKQAEEFKPKYISIFDKAKFKKFRSNNSRKLLAGEEGLLELSAVECDILVVGISGLAALKPLLSSLNKAKRVLLANKEAIISAGQLLSEKLRKSSSEVLPVDSEAWAVFNLLKSTENDDLLNIYITASGGPFLHEDERKFKDITSRQVLKHPVWKMGKRISVDSATLMNKGFEIMEINRFFGIPVDRIKVVIHPQSVVHAFLEKKDRSFLSSLFFADMRIPIASCLGYPGDILFVRHLCLEKVNRLDFFKPDYKKFPSLRLAYSVARKGKSYPAVLVAADEEAVKLHLKGKISFSRIYEVVEKVVASHRARKLERLDDVFFWESWAKEKVRQVASKLCLRH